MEFSANAKVRWTAEEIQERVRLETLCELCPSIEELLSFDPRGDRGVVFTVWGEFDIQRETLAKGVRFTFPSCIQALQWTITSDHYNEGEVLIHVTVCHPALPDLVRESIEVFVEQWRDGLQEAATVAPAA